VQAAPVSSRAHLALAEPQAVVVNSGVANAATGERGELDALATAAEAARLPRLDAEEVLVLSTGVIGAPLPHEAAPGLVDAALRSRTAAADAPRRS
jgi:glutamate N-acetyltransferase/amino-acid N-acetyltransferase